MEYNWVFWSYMEDKVKVWYDAMIWIADQKSKGSENTYFQHGPKLQKAVQKHGTSVKKIFTHYYLLKSHDFNTYWPRYHMLRMLECTH